MKFFTTFLCLMSLGAFANESLSEMKMNATKDIDGRLSTLKDERACILKARTESAFHSCRMQSEESNEMMPMHNMRKAKNHRGNY